MGHSSLARGVVLIGRQESMVFLPSSTVENQKAVA